MNIEIRESCIFWCNMADTGYIVEELALDARAGHRDCTYLLAYYSIANLHFTSYFSRWLVYHGVALGTDK